MAEDSSRIQRVKNKLNKVHDKIQIRVEDFKDDLQEKYGAKSKITNFVSHMSISSEENNEIKSSKSLLSLESNDADNNTFSSSSDNIALSPSCDDFGKLKLSAKIKVLKQILSKGSLSKEESKQILNISSTELNLIEQELSTRNEKLLSDDGFDSYKKRWKSEGSDMDCKDLFAESSCDEERKLSQISDDLTSTSSSNSKRSDWPPEKEEGGGCLSPEVPPFHYPHGIHFANPADILEKLGHRFPKLKEKGDIVHRYFQRSTRLCDVNKRLKCQIWSSVVTIVLVEAKGLTAMDQDTGSSDPYCKFRLGNEKYKSKVIWRSLNPCWLEQFDLHLYDDQEQLLELTLWDRDKQSKDDFLGRCVIDLSMLEREKTHNIRQNLEDNNGEVFLLLTISGTTSSETITDLTNYQDNPRERSIIEDKFKWSRLDVWNEAGSGGVGWLCVKVFGAKGLAAADLGGKSDPFCVLELVNARLQTHTEYKTLAPNWMKIFTFNVKDISSVLEITVYDEDHDHKVEFLGKLAVPLLNITNGDKRWFSLKDKKMRARAKGNCPQILLEMTVIWNPVKACVRTLNPKEEKYMQTEIKFKRQVFLRNVIRLKSIIMWFIEIGKILQACFEWESRIRSFLALLVWIFACNYFEPWMAPFGLLLLFGRNWLIFWLTGGSYLQQPIDDEELLAEEDEDDPEQDKEEKKSLKERLQAIQEVTQSVQNSIGYMASLGEEVKNLFNFTVPYLSWLAVILLFAASFVLFLIPVRYLLMLWGINKFARKILRPHTIPNNEVLDLLSRVPDDEDLLDFRELKTHPTNDARREVRKKHKAS